MTIFHTKEQYDEYQSTLEQESMSSQEYLRESLFQHTSAYGAERPDDAWILSPFDTWEANPHYSGPSRAHPENEDGCRHEWAIDNEVGYHACTLYWNHLEELELSARADEDAAIYEGYEGNDNDVFNDVPF